MASPLDIENIRKKTAEQIKGDTSKILDVNVSSIQKATPGSLKPQGSARLSNAITALGKKIYTVLTPIAISIAKELGASVAQEQLGSIKEKIVPKNGCPTDSKLLAILAQRDALILQLNKINTQLDKLTKAVTGLNNFLEISQTAIDTIKTVKTSTSLAVKTVPSPPGTPGIVSSTLSDLEDVINKLLFEKDGTPRLPKISSSIASATLAISIINGYIQLIIIILTAIDNKIKQCNPNLISSLTPINPNLISISILQTKAEQTLNNVTYAGFVIEIEEIPYTPTVNRRRAVGKNQSGIKLIQTELSFTTQDDILINELKLIIDKDNLKAY